MLTNENYTDVGGKDFAFYSRASSHNAELQRRRDDRVRNDPAVQAQVASLIDRLADLITEEAGQLAATKGEAGDRFVIDDLSEILLWQLQEFIGQFYCERDDEVYAVSARAHQLTADHVRHWYSDD